MTAPALARLATKRNPRNDARFMSMMHFIMDQEGSAAGAKNFESNLAAGAGLTSPAVAEYLRNSPNDPEATRFLMQSTPPSPDLTLRVYHSIYRQSGADTLPPALGLVHFDAAVNQGQGAAKRMLAQSDSDPTKYIALRAARYASNPQVEDQPGWLQKRIPALQSAIQQMTPVSQGALERSIP